MKSDTPGLELHGAIPWAQASPSDPLDASQATAGAGLTRSPHPVTAQTRPIPSSLRWHPSHRIRRTATPAQRASILLPAAVRTQLRRGEPTVRLLKPRAAPGALVLQFRQEARHASIGDGPRQPGSSSVQRFHHQLGYRRRRLVMRLTTRACNLRLLAYTELPAMDVPAAGIALSTRRSRFSAPARGLGF